MKEIRISFEIIELEKDSYHIVTEVGLPSGERGLMIIDTGASKTVFDKSFIGTNTEIELHESEISSGGLGGSLEEIYTCELEYIEISSFRMEKAHLAVLDLSNINELYSVHSNKKIAALLGSDILLKYKAIIDYGKSEMILFV